MPAGFRPIVADNGSADDSAAIAASYGARVVPVPQRGFGAACHAGLLAATSDVAVNEHPPTDEYDHDGKCRPVG